MFDVVGVCVKAREASYSLATMDNNQKNAMLECIANAITQSKDAIKSANDIDIARLTGTSQIAFMDRLMLDDERIDKMAEGVRQIMSLPDPIGEVTDSWTMYNGIKMNKVRCPLGVIGVIYEARPNVTIDVAALCLKSGNAVVLRGGKEAINSNRALYNIIKRALEENGFDANVVGFVDEIDREATRELLEQERYVDVIIPRGGNGLKKFVLEHAHMPVIASAGGNCHTYIEGTADINMASEILFNAKMQRPTVCNATEHLLIDRSIVSHLGEIVAPLVKAGCTLLGDDEVVDAIGCARASQEDYFTEYLDYTISIHVVADYNEAINWINDHGTKHSEAIVSDNRTAIDMFTRKVDAGAVYVNASTRFTDGFEYGFGAEIGISTQKLHARGPLGLKQLTSEKYIAFGNGQIRK